MRLINVHTLEMKQYGSSDLKPEYAILSHMWSDDEVLFADYQKAYEESRPDSQGREHHIDTGKGKVPWKHLLNPDHYQVPKDTGWGKIAWACNEARNNLKGGADKSLWIDSCCIDKSKQTEESESFSLMAQWYGGAEVCYTYLQDVSNNELEYTKKERQHVGAPLDGLGQFGWSRWFDRGWTLQELLAPPHMQFFDYNWDFIDTRQNLSLEIEAATKIDQRYLNDGRYKEACIAIKMSWMANRTTSKVEDTAYALLGLFGVRMPTDYGEGPAAFIRLQETLIEKYEDQDESIFAWTDPTNQLLERRPASRTNIKKLEFYGLLAPWPSCFANMSSILANSKGKGKRRIPYTIKNGGIIFHLPAFFSDEGNGIYWNNLRAEKRSKYALNLNCWIAGKENKGSVVISLARDDQNRRWRRVVEEDLMIAKSTRTSHDRFFSRSPKTREAHIPHVPGKETDRAEELSHWVMKRDDTLPALGVERKCQWFQQRLKE